MRKFWMTALMMTVAVAGAQVIKPTTDSGPDKIDINVVCTPGNTSNLDCGDGLSATVQQTVNLSLPQATALHLDAATLTFDISQIGSQDDTWYCAYGKKDSNGDPMGDNGPNSGTHGGLGADFWNQTQVKPLGTSYSAITSNKDMKIAVDAGARVTQYPPIVKADEVDNDTKAYFVCYRSFIIQKFSNVGNFKLSVSRDNPDGVMGKQMMYIQDNPCSSFGTPTGLYELKPGTSRELIPRRLTTGTTGARAANAAVEGTNVCRSYTSWLDDLVVIAVVVDGDKAGDNNAVLTYTLESSAAGWNTSTTP